MAPWRFHDETRELDETVRREAPGAFIALPDGVTHYELAGPPDGRPVVLIHGFSTPYYLWDPTAVALAEAGFRVLRYDLYGRGYSDRPDLANDAALFCRQLHALITALGLSLPVDVFGISMGGVIAVSFADAYPDWVRKLVLVDPAGMITQSSWMSWLVRLPYLGEWVMDHFGTKTIVDGLAKDLHNAAAVAAYQEKYLAQMQIVGFRKSLLSTVRSGMVSSHRATYERVGQHPRPVLLIWGREDRMVPFETSEQVVAAMPQAEFHAIDNAGHIPHYERPDVVNPLLLEFLSRAEKAQAQ